MNNPNDPQILPTLNPSIAQDPQFQEDHLHSQSSKALTVDPNRPQYPQDSPMEDHNDPTQTDSASAPSPRNADPCATAAVASRRGPKRKKLGPKRTAQERRSREKFQVLVETLKPIPFVPSKALDFTGHETLLKRLGLWDFVHVEFDCSVRSDLLSQLIASYAPASRCSYVSGVRIAVNRADLGRALKLPVKKTAVAAAEDVGEGVDLAESIAFVEELVSKWMLLHEDAYIMPPEVLNFTKLIKEGHLEKVDWAGLIWNMVEKELKAPQLLNCYYASHLQHLIKTQHEELLRKEAPEAEVEVKDEEEEDEEGEGEGEGEEDDEDGSGDVKMRGVDDCQVHELEEHSIELSLGQQDNVENVEVQKEQVGGEQTMNFEQTKEEPGQWLLGQKNNDAEPFLQQCNSSDVTGLDLACGQKKDEEGEEGQEQEEEEEDEEEDPEDDEHEDGFHLSSKCISLEGMSSGTGNLIQTMEAAQLPFSSGIDLRDNALGDFLSSRDDPQMISGASLFGNGHKRDIGLDNHNSHHSLNGSSKRLRSDSPWNDKPVDFNLCMDQIQHWVGKARLMYATKEQSCEDSTMNQQFLLNELQKRENMIEHLHKVKLDESQKRQMDVYRCDKELHMMANLVEGYRKALRETQKAFAEYRMCCPQADEALYKDAPGSGGLVLTVMELEKECLKQEEEERMKLLVIEKKLRDFEGVWTEKLEGHLSRVQSLRNRVLTVEDQVKLMNEMNAKIHKVSYPPECAPSEGQTA